MNESSRKDATGNQGWSAESVRPTFERARLALIAYRVEALCAGILLAMALNMIAVTARKSITADEIVLIPAAYYHLITNDIQLVREHPPLCKLLAGVPLLFLQPLEPAPNQIDASSNRGNRDWFYTEHFWQDNRSQFEAISFWSRLPMIAVTLALGLLIFIFARDLFGSGAALFAVALVALEPTLLAHGQVVQTDVIAAFGFLLTVFAVHRYLRMATWKLAAGVGAAAGLGMLAKFSMAILGPALLVLFVILLWRRPLRRATMARHGIVATIALLLVINAGYFFRRPRVTEADAQWIASSFPDSSLAVLGSVRVLRFVVPTDFLMGTYWQLHHSRQGHSAALLGMHSHRGWWYYFPVAFALKATIPFLLLSLSALAWATYRLVYKRENQLLILLVPFALYTGLVLMSPIDIGIRYYLPAFTFLFILGGDLLDSLLRGNGSRPRRLAFASIVFVTVSWMSWETIRAYPNYIPYMNQFASARPHWWYLSDSNVEWGEAVKELGEYLRTRGETRTRAILLGGYATLGFYGVEYLDALGPVPANPPRYLALGASFLNGSTVPSYERNGQRVSEEMRLNTFAEFRNRTPEAVIGNSIYVYRVGD